MTFVDTAVTLVVLVGLFFIVYSKVTDKSIADLIRELKEVFQGETEEIPIT